MNNENQHLAEEIRSGRYFEQARGWFQAIYISPISERTVFMLVAGLSLMVLLGAFISLSSLLPVTEQKRVILYAPERADEVVPRLVSLKEKGEDTNMALQRFFLEQYVMAREGYSFASFARNALFVHAHSTADAYAQFEAAADPANAESYAAKLSNTATREISVGGIRWVPGEQKNTATVTFTSEIIGAEDNAKTKWTAKIEYTYKELTVSSSVDPDSGEEKLETTDPEFQVVNYVVEPRS